MKRVLLISFEYPTGKTYCGGVGQVVKQCREALIKSGYEVYVLISSEFQKKKPVRLLRPDDSLVRHRNLWSFQKQYDWLTFDYIVQHFVNWAGELEKVKARRKSRPKIIYHFHSLLKREKESGFKTFNRFLLNQEKMIEIADKIICPSRYEYDNFNRYFPYFSEKVALIENTVEVFPPEKEEIEGIKSLHGIKEDDVVSIYVGRLERIKGIDVLIRHIPKILHKHKNLKIFMIGKSLDRNYYKQLMKMQRRFPRNLFYMRYLKKKTLFQYYYLSHICLNTSLSESFSLSTHESALCGNTLLLNSLPVFDKFRGAALFFSNYGTNGNGFTSAYESLIKDKKQRKSLSDKSSRIAKDFLVNNRLEEDLSKLFKAF